MKESEMRQVGRWIAEVLNSRNDASVFGKVRRNVLELAEAFPLYAGRREKAHANLEA
jgi:glycine/serine hydroxymethyltransferase